MITRALRLYLISIASFFHKLRYDLAREIVVGLSSVILFATFFYVFNDFLNIQVKSLSQMMRDQFAESLCITVLIVSAGVAAGFLRTERLSQQTLRKTAACLGESPMTISVYLGGRILTVIIVCHGIAWYLANRWLVNWSPLKQISWELLMLLITTVLSLWPEMGGKSLRFHASRLSSSPISPISPIQAMVQWRLQQILWRNRLTRFCIVLSLFFAALVLYASWRQAPVFVSVAAGFFAGYLVAITLSFQLAEDLNYAWAERALGVSHDEFIGAYQRMGLLLGASIGLLTGILYLIGSPPISLEKVNEFLQITVVSGLPAGICPLLLFQIDGRKPTVTIVTLLVVALFLGTAILPVIS